MASAGDDWKDRDAHGNADESRNLPAAGDAAGSVHETVDSGAARHVTSDAKSAPTIESGGAVRAGGRDLEQTGQMIGRYKLLQPLGEGGFGSVWMAEQEQPVKRRVALKIIKLGMDTRQVIARFEAERQALALMDHPNIAKVLDAGATDTGRPYFVMELVKGIAISDYCNKHNMPFRARLRLFGQVCSAVQHAHQKGIIHRDIKPSNVLVSLVDDKPAPKVIDFGVAKATQARLTEQTMFTEIGQFIGTPAYMSPEQADPHGEDIDTRSDIYSLGVLLYELLTGTTPFDSKSLRKAGIDEIKRIIREEDPPRPSTRLSSLGRELDTVARQRSIEPKKLGTILRGDLDWIIMKAIEKDRGRRYETANGLAMDIERFLAGEAVVAAPPSASYRLRKLIKRNKGPVIAAGGVATALVLGLAGTIWQARVASEQRDRARSEAARADDRAAAAQKAETEQRRLAAAEAEQRHQAAEQRDRAVAAEAMAHQRADDLQRVADFQGQMLAQVDPASAGVRLTEDIRARFDAALAKSAVPDDERGAQVDLFIGQWSRVNATDTALELIDRTILKPAVAVIEKQFVDQPAVAATLRHVLAERYHDLGLDEAARTLEEQALAERRRVLGEEHPDTLLSIGNLGAYMSGLGKNEEAERYHREALEKSRRVRGDYNPETMVCIANLGDQFLKKGEFSTAETYFREALERRRRVLGDEDPDTLKSVRDWGTLLEQQGKLSEAETYYREALEKRRRVLGEEHRDTLTSINDLAVLMKSQGKLDEAVEFFRDVTEKKRRTLGEVHPSTLSSIQNLGTVLGGSGHPVEAESLMRDVLAKQQRLLGPDHTSTLVTLGNLSAFLIGQDKLTEAEPLCRETLERRQRLLGPNHAGTLIANNVMGLVLIRQGKLDEGEPYWRAALETAQRVLGPTHPETLVYAHNLGGLAIDRNKLAEAEQLFREVIQSGSATIGAGHPTVLSATRKLGGILLEQKRYSEAAELLSAAEPAARKAHTGPNERYLASFLRDLGAARARLDQFAAAEPNLVEVHAIFTKVRGESHAETRSAMQALTAFYATWNDAEPGNGYDARSATWRAKLDAMSVSTRPATTSPATTQSQGTP